MPQLVRGPEIAVRSRVFDSSRWDGYRPRPDDIVIATYSKCGTTWMQRIVAMLVMQSAEPQPVWDLSPWPDMRIFGPIEEVLAHAEALTHRRFFKSHLPFDALPVYEGVKFIHVARDGRDAAMSLHNHLLHFNSTAGEMLDAVSLADPKFGDRYPATSADPAVFFHQWVVDGGDQGDPGVSFWHTERSFWAARDNPNVLLVHYADLKADREGEMRRVADFLAIEIADDLWPDLVEAAGFDAMKRDAERLVPMAEAMWEGGARRFIHKGINGRWRDVFAAEDLEAYAAKAEREFPPDLARWLEHGRLGAPAERRIFRALCKEAVMGRIMLFAAAALLLATAAIHASGRAMVESWTQGFDDQQAAVVSLVWTTDSIDWAVVAVLWALAGWRRERGWLGAAAVAMLIPLAGGVGVTSIDYTFFGGWMLLGSVVLAVAGLAASWRK